MKITVDHNLCIGCGICANMCSECFEMRDDMKSYVLEGEACTKAECAESAAGACPVQAIEIN